MIPGGRREFQQWIIPVQPRGAAGVSSGVYGGGVCSGGYEGLYGTGSFIWPTINHYISGNDYWSGHLAIDIGSSLGEPISAADSGVVVFAGWATGGYGNTVAIDHGNGYQTLYAHLDSVVATLWAECYSRSNNWLWWQHVEIPPAPTFTLKFDTRVAL